MVQLAESRGRFVQQRVRIAKLSQSTVVQYGHLVEVDNRFELVCYRDDGMLGELLADNALDQGICNVVDTERKEQVS